MKRIALLVGAAFAKEIADGKCPFRPGEVQSKVKADLDYSKLQGMWINMFDEREIKDHFLCMSLKLL